MIANVTISERIRMALLPPITDEICAFKSRPGPPALGCQSNAPDRNPVQIRKKKQVHACLLWVKGCRCYQVGSTSGVPQIAADLSHRPTRQPWAIQRPNHDVTGESGLDPFPDGGC